MIGLKIIRTTGVPVSSLV